MRGYKSGHSLIGEHSMNSLNNTWFLRRLCATGAAVVIGLSGGCSTSGVQVMIDQPMPAYLQAAMTSDQPTFAVGDELGWLAFGDLALAPQPTEPGKVLVVAQAKPIPDAGFDWIGRYLTLSRESRVQKLSWVDRVTHPADSRRVVTQ